MNIAICDDDSVCVEQLRSFLNNCDEVNRYKAKTYCYLSSKQFCNAIVSNAMKFEIVFMDLEMPEIDGVAASEIMRGKMSSQDTFLIFISSHKNYSLELYDFEPFGFLSKPIDLEKANLYMRRIANRLKTDNYVYDFNVNKSTVILPQKSILYLESVGRNITVVYKESNVYHQKSFIGTMAEQLLKLDSNYFISPHKSYIVNMNYIKVCEAARIVMENGFEINVSRLKRAEVKTEFADFVRKRIYL